MSIFDKITLPNREVSLLSIQSRDYIPVIAEIGINHNGDLKIAKELIKMAKRTGCDAVKFQKRDIETVYSREVLDSPRESPWGTTQRDQKNGLEFGKDEYEEIDTFCREQEIEWSASAWDLKSLEFVENFKPAFHKVASAMLTNLEFVEAVASLGRPTLVSVGMSTQKNVDNAVSLFRRKGTPFILLHTVSTYPSPEEHLNLMSIPRLAERYGSPIGYSGHESTVSPSIVAASLGAMVIERHITLDRTMYGSDQSASLEEQGLRNLVSVMRKLPSMLGSGEKILAPGEQVVAEKLRYWL